MRYGYARTSTTEQNPEAQVAALQAAGCDVIRTEQKSGTKLEGRTELATRGRLREGAKSYAKDLGQRYSPVRLM
ncbi:recombinase family protein, partial [Gluconacetobacter entanii]|uniref:recombinase family protein n=1 Tax=Gluconacetobacter entanii TaxID=108528 RepID=UPI0022360D2F